MQGIFMRDMHLCKNKSLFYSENKNFNTQKMYLKGIKNQINVYLFIYQCIQLHTSKCLFKIKNRHNFINSLTKKISKKSSTFPKKNVLLM